MRLVLLLPLAVLAACSTDDSGSAAGTDPIPLTTGSYAGSYRVPTDASLAAAATFDVAQVRWEVLNGNLKLDYDLPVGLVGGELRIRLEGTIAPGATSVTVTGEQGTGTCTAVGTTITCREVFADLGVMPISSEIVAQHAAQEYAGPANDRIRVANIFGSDPIGFVDIDTTTRVDTDD